MSRPAVDRRSWLPGVPPRVDVAIAAGFAVLALAEGLSQSERFSPALTAGYVACLSLIAWRRRFPLVVAALVLVSMFLIDPEQEFTILLSIVLLSFTVGMETKPPRSHFGLVVLLIPFVGGLATEGLVPSDLAAAGVFIIGPWAVGTLVQERTHRAAEADARAAELQAQHDEAQRTAAAQERTRIARELHDIVSHAISVVTVQTQAVRRRLGPEQQAEAADLARVESVAREAMAEMRRLFGVLRSDGESAPLAPQPGIGELDRLVEHARSSGLVVDVDIDAALPDLGPGLDLTAYRIVQEGLTNAVRHAGARRAQVTIRRAEGGILVSVTDDGAGMGAESGGFGLVGIRERIALYDGRLELGNCPGGGFSLTARLPLEAQ